MTMFIILIAAFIINIILLLTKSNKLIEYISGSLVVSFLLISYLIIPFTVLLIILHFIIKYW